MILSTVIIIFTVSAVQYMRRGNMFMPCYKARHKVKDDGKPVGKLSDSKWLQYISFLVDRTNYLSELTISLSGPKQLLSSLLANLKSFRAISRLSKVQLEGS